MSFFTHALSWKISFTLHTGRVHGDAINQCMHTHTHTHARARALVSRGQCYSCLKCYKSSVDRECQLANEGRNGVSHTRLCTHIQTRRLHLAPLSATTLASCMIPPGRSTMVTLNRTSRPSAANPRSMQRPSAVVSMFPPHNGITTLHQKATAARVHWTSH